MATRLVKVLMFMGSILRVSKEVRLFNKPCYSSEEADGEWWCCFVVSPAFLCISTGARWDISTGVLSEAVLKDLTPAMPVLYIRAVPADKLELNNIYECPVYRTKLRGPNFIWSFHLKTRHPPAKWVLAGVALLLSVWVKILQYFIFIIQIGLWKRPIRSICFFIAVFSNRRRSHCRFESISEMKWCVPVFFIYAD